MKNTDPHIDTYIEKSADFAQPILRHIREMVHQHCPDVSETIKWSMPHFEYKGSIFCHFAAFKKHCALGFWYGELLQIDSKLEKAMGQFGRITSLADLPDEKAFVQLLKEAMKLHDAGAKLPSRNKEKSEKKELQIPSDFLNELERNSAALATFEAFPYSQKKEYVAWYTEAKTEATRTKRLQQAIAWMAEGKRRNWKYEKC
ncbi:YdeI/OmpD-associated family protein [Undibacterium amnicola]|uniref:YdeI/OmpD-associated family protein n=1 Tax=Undibacterium amnicola TaxID=1834038 RepID=A0ABR6XS18_9BURK|nr:YdeI/OmpD-associated family protein [Undibacterium amnicola]MBC3831834.1 YdeI/OmpD-associated family protein [Undibacterium amnicola]